MAESTSPTKKKVGPLTFFAQVRQEGRKVTWTSRKELVAATIMVLIMVAVAAVFFYFADVVVSIAVRFLTGVEQVDG
jgi:preprotein translocase subunit SecE